VRRVVGTEATTEARVSEPLRKEGFFYYGCIETDGARKVFFSAAQLAMR
jgi:hypothetical protein